MVQKFLSYRSYFYFFSILLAFFIFFIFINYSQNHYVALLFLKFRFFHFPFFAHFPSRNFLFPVPQCHSRDVRYSLSYFSFTCRQKIFLLFLPFFLLKISPLTSISSLNFFFTSKILYSIIPESPFFLFPPLAFGRNHFYLISLRSLPNLQFPPKMFPNFSKIIFSQSAKNFFSALIHIGVKRYQESHFIPFCFNSSHRFANFFQKNIFFFFLIYLSISSIS